MNSEKSVQVDSLISSPVEEGNGSTDAPPPKCIRLPEPDVENITVLTRQLPNDPILPWHHYDSPWLEPNLEETTEETLEEALEETSDETLEKSPEEIPEATKINLSAEDAPRSHEEPAPEEPAEAA